MISEREARKVYGRDVEVVRRGDRKWSSDRDNANYARNEARAKEGGAVESKAHQKLQSARFHLNPLSLMNQHIALQERASLPELPDPAECELGTELVTDEGRDRVCYRLVDYGKGPRWKRAWTSKGGADRG